MNERGELRAVGELPLTSGAAVNDGRPGGSTPWEPEAALAAPASAVERAMLERLNARVFDVASTEGKVDARFAFLPSPMGRILVVATDRGLLRIGFDTEDPEAVLLEVSAVVGPIVVEDPEGLRLYLQELEEFFEGGRRTFDLPLDFALTKLGGFRATVQQALAKIPFGSTRSYTEMATMVGNPKAVRAVGSACAQNPLPIVLPCHRVVRTDGSFGNYRGGHDRKKWILEWEARLAG